MAVSPESTGRRRFRGMVPRGSCLTGLALGAIVSLAVAPAAPGADGAASVPRTAAVRCAEPRDADADLPECRPDWAERITCISGYRRSQVVSAWLRNGVRVHHLRIVAPGVPAGSGTVMVTVSFFGGELLETPANRGISLAACSAWDQLSAADLPPARIPSAMEGRDLGIEGVAGPDLLQIRLRGRAADIEVGMRIVGALLTRPRITSATLDATVQSVIRALAARAANPAHLVGGAILDALYPSCEARVRPPSPDQLLAITCESAQQWLDDHLLRAPVEASIVGDIPVDEAMRLAGGFLGDLPARSRVSAGAFREQRAVPCPAYPLRRTLSRTLPPGGALVVVGFPGADGSQLAEQRVLRVAARILGERAAAALRREGFEEAQPDAAAIPGGIYPGFGVVAYNVRTDPDRADAAGDLLERVVLEMAAGGVYPGEVEAARTELVAAFERVDRQPQYWAQLLARLDAGGIDLDEAAGGAAFYESVNAETISAAVRRSVGDGRTLRLIILPEQPRDREPPARP